MRFNLRHLRVLLAVVETHSVTRAAELCHVSQPAVTQALSKIEAVTGEVLFTRSPQGLFANGACEVLAKRVRRALDFLDRAFEEVAPRLKVTATLSQLEALIAVREQENYTLAAKRLGVSQPTVHRAVSQLEREAGRPLFERTAYGIMASRAAQLLAQAARLALAELSQAEADLAESRAEERGRLVIGSMPLSRSYILPAAIARFRQQRPRLPIQVVEGAYGELLAGLRRGEIDFLIGALRDPPPIGDVEQEVLFYDTVVIVAGHQHPLAGRDNITVEDLAAFPWVVSMASTPIRQHFDQLFLHSAHGPPTSIVESGSLILMRELLGRSNHLGFVSGGQARAEIDRSLVTALKVDLAHTRRPIGLTRRKDWLPTAAQRLFLEHLRVLEPVR
ncbi:LysR family transcriptional regulator [Rhizobium paknamense]|uniref:DNA-binding transcriptional LysR family regulator n=1 Tax=Rhizobium paknamense TaxID=1206817 RepID=A0ABU0IHX9_9HYPH|nr:LysR family transcriptional regulator [Rhizobium paknamense]MDQ0456804.1 DNA-binding transcriptional LysR family regulator [Rhizobium paknamense]